MRLCRLEEAGPASFGRLMLRVLQTADSTLKSNHVIIVHMVSDVDAHDDDVSRRIVSIPWQAYVYCSASISESWRVHLY